MRTKIFCFIFTTRILLGKVGSQHTCVEFIELNWVLVLSWKSIPRNLSESPLFWHTGPFSPPELCSVLLFWPSAFIPFLITNASCYSRSLSKSLICFLQNIFTLCCIICFLRKAFISIMSLSFFEYPTPCQTYRMLLAALSCLSCNLIVKQLSLTTIITILNYPVYTASTLSPTGLKPFYIHSSEILFPGWVGSERGRVRKDEN